MTLVADSCPPKGNAKAAMTAESDNTNSCSLTLPLIRSLQRLSCHVPQCLLRDCIELVLREQQEEKLSNVTCGTTTETASSAPGKQLLSKELSQKFLLSEMLHTKKGDPSGPDMTTKLGGQQDLSVCPSGCACPSPPSSSNKKGDDTIIYSRDKLMETLATVERMLEEDFSDSGDEGDSYTTDSSYIASRSGHSITSRSGKCTETSEEEEDNSFSSYEEELSDLDEEDDEDHCSEDDSEDVNGMGESNQGTAVLKQRRAQRLSEASTPSQKDHTTVKKLRQGRLVARTSSFESARSVESENSKDAAASTPIDPETTNLPTNPLPSPLVGRLPTKREKGALLFVDMSGFTALSTTLELEPFSKVIHAYFQRIVDIIHQYGGDIQKFAGDAVFALWSPRSKGDDGDGKGPANDEEAALAAAMCAVKLVDLCSDFTVDIPALDPASTSTATTLLNIYAAVGFGDIVTTHVGGHGSTARMEYVLLGDTIRQVSEGLRVSKEGEAVISAEVVELLERDHITLKPKSQSCVRREDGIQVLAYKNETFFLPKNNFGNLANLHTSMQAFSLKESQAFVFEQCQYWTPSMLEKLKRYISPYVHSVVVSEETNAISQSNMTSHRLRGSLLSPSVSTLNEEIHQEQQSLAELRDVCSIFIQPDIPSSVLMGNEADDGGLLDQLNRIMLIISSEVDRFDAHLKQFIVDDKGIVAIFNFGLRGSTYPNMIEERVMPCITHVRTLLNSELGLSCSIGVTYGKAFCGLVSKGRSEYTVLGPAVNLAARMMSHFLNPGIMVDEVTKEKAGNRPFTSVCPIRAKGYTNYVNIYIPEDNVQRLDWNECPCIVGHDQDVASIIRRAETVLEKNSGSEFVFVEGPYGIGKSTLLSYTAQKIQDMCNTRSRDAIIFRRVCSDEDSFHVFSIIRPLFLDILRHGNADKKYLGDVQLVGHSDTHGVDEIEEAQLYVCLLQACLECNIPLHFVEVIGGLIFSTRLSDIGSWSDAATRIDEWNQLSKQLVKVASHCIREKQMLLLGLDNLSGLDEMSWKFLEGLFDCATNVLIIGAARNESDLNICWSDWGNLKNMKINQFLHVHLEPLDEQGVSELVQNHLNGKTFVRFEQNVARTVYLESKGNPLLACEILGALYPSFSTTGPDVFDTISTVKNVEELVLNRIDSLSPRVRPFLYLGAMLGSPFYISDVIAVMEQYYRLIGHEGVADVSVPASQCLQEATENGLLSISAYEYLDFGVCEVTAYSFSHSIWQETIAKLALDEWKETMRRLINDVALKNDKKVSKIAPLKRRRRTSMPVIREKVRDELVEEDVEQSKCSGRRGKLPNLRLQAMPKMFRRSYRSSGQRGANDAIQKLKGMLKSTKNVFKK